MSQRQQGQAPAAASTSTVARGRRGSSRQKKDRGAPLSSIPSRDPGSDWQLPQRYQLRTLLGSGAYGTVCEALDKDKGRMVAIKRIPNVFCDLVLAKRVLREVSILARIEDPHIVRMYDIFVPANDLLSFDDLFVVMEIGDTDLKGLMQTDIEFTEAHVKWIFYNLICGLHYLHAAGVLHRDLKPSNVLVNRDCAVKICDFGLARAMGNLSEPASLTPVGALAYSSQKGGLPGFDEPAPAPTPTTRGASSSSSSSVRAAGSASRRAMSKHVATRFYRAPELCLLQDNYSEAVDMWAAGCIYGEMTQLLPGFKIEDRRPLLPGSSCFPLSPEPAHPGDGLYHSRARREQMNLIFDLIGTPSSAEVDQLDREDARAYLRWFAPRPGMGIRRRLPHIDDDSADLLRRLLRFGPRDRMDARGALEHRLLADIRDTASETLPLDLMELDFDRPSRPVKHSEEQLRQFFAEEISAISQDGASLGSVGGA